MKPQPTRQMRLVGWQLVHKVPVTDTLTEDHERRACERTKLPWETWQQAKATFPRLMANVLSQRHRRRLWQEHFGPVPDGWTPPDPRRPQTRNQPTAALAHWKAKELGIDGRHLDDWFRQDRILDLEWSAPEATREAYARASNGQKPAEAPVLASHHPGR